MSGERGSALVIAVLVMAILTLLGMSYLLLADTENKIAENERLSAQALYFGEGVVREVKRWFDRPPYTARGEANLVRPTTAVMVRNERLIDVDGAGPTDPVPADGSAAHPYYKMGNDQVFDKPYRAELTDMFVGKDDDGADVKIERARDAATAAFLDALSEKIMPDFPAGAAGVHARIDSIHVYAPPYLDAGGGNWVRYGVATVSARVQILRNPGAADEQVLADRTLKAVLNETPYAGAFGPLHSCDELGWDNAFKVHWGPATTSTTGNLPVVPREGMSRSIPRDLPPTARTDTLRFHLPSGDAAWTALRTSLEGHAIDDPWFRFFAGLNVQNWIALPSPQAHPPVPVPTDQDESNKFQNYPNLSCPEYNYETWKTIARSGGSDVHYYSWNGTKFSENGTGALADFEELTNGKTGLFFFDTWDGLAPHDFDASNVAANLTPEIRITDPGYGTRGFLYVNTKMWHVDGAPGRPAKFTLPGEPFRDKNENGVRDDDEDWINLNYTEIHDIDDVLRVKAADTYPYDPTTIPPPAPIWNSLGPSVAHDAIVWGILYVSGQFDASGTPYYDGSVVTFAGTETGAKTPGTANLYWDPMLKDNWPPPDWDLPRVITTGWQTHE